MKLTEEQAYILTATTGIGCMDFSKFHEIAEKELGRPIFTHEMARTEFWEEIRSKVKDRFIEICHV